MFLSITGLLLILSTVECFTPNCIIGNQFKFYRFPIEGCSQSFPEKCKFHPAGYFKALGEITLVKIGETEVLPTCAFYNVESLKRIYGVNSKIKVLATKAFMDLDALDSISLAFNWITELREGIFNNVTVDLLDLSWNKIVFIDTHALSGINGLKQLNLSKNSIMTLSINSLPKSVGYLDLGHNLLSRIAVNSHKFTNLTFINFSFNSLEKIALSFSYPITEIDFTNNRLKDFDYIDIASVKMFRIGMNMFEEMPKYLESLNAKEIDLYPNPWKCDQLFLLWETLISFNIRLAPKQKNKNPPAECFTTGGTLGATKTRSTPCLDDHECPDYMLCRTKKCLDPCENTLCHPSSICQTKNHQFSCTCQTPLLSNPLDLHGECKKIDCFTNANCPYGRICWNEKCLQIDNITSFNKSDGKIDKPTTRRPKPPAGSAVEDLQPNPELPWWFDDIPETVSSIPSRKSN